MNNSAQLQIFGTIGEAKISYKTSGIPYAKIHSSQEVVTFLRKVWDEDTLEYTESFLVICLNRSNHIVAYKWIGHGGTAGVTVDVKNVMQFALLSHSSSIVLAHNHPSGNTRPSSQDLKITQTIKSAGQILDIPVIDHLILTKDSYTSFADDGLL